MAMDPLLCAAWVPLVSTPCRFAAISHLDLYIHECCSWICYSQVSRSKIQMAAFRRSNWKTSYCGWRAICNFKGRHLRVRKLLWRYTVCGEAALLWLMCDAALGKGGGTRQESCGRVHVPDMADIIWNFASLAAKREQEWQCKLQSFRRLSCFPESLSSCSSCWNNDHLVQCLPRTCFLFSSSGSNFCTSCDPRSIHHCLCYLSVALCQFVCVRGIVLHHNFPVTISILWSLQFFFAIAEMTIMLIYFWRRL